MPKARREKPIYTRGEFKLYARAGRNHEIIWYDEQRKRERSVSAGTTDPRAARTALDNEYVKKHGGVPHCPTCHQPINQRGEFVAVLIANYRETKPKGDAIFPRLDHVLTFMAETKRAEDRAEHIDDDWAESFRDWMRARADRVRSPGTIENSLIQLGAAMRFGGVKPSFEPIPTSEVNRSPQYRASVATLAKMFRYAMEPKKKRENLLRYLRAAVATWARPDAIYDISTAADRHQWHSDSRVLNLNPVGRKQTKKYRATIVIARQFAPHLDATKGAYISVSSVRSAWDAMGIDLKLPTQGEAGQKLIRRSVSHLARKILGEEHWVQGRIMLGHHKHSTSDLYALLDPANLGLALAATEQIIDQIEKLAPGAFYRDDTATGGNVRSIMGAKNG
jgi:hypothetical protein